MKSEQRTNGLIVPVAPVEVTFKRIESTYPAMEIQDPNCRKATSDALLQLWKEADLSRGDGDPWCREFNQPTRLSIHRKAFYYLADLMLGKDAPEGEVYP